MARPNCIKSANLTPEQIRAARGLLDWSRAALAKRSGVSVRTLASVESGESTAKNATMEAISKAFITAGIKFIKENGGGYGVRLAKKHSASRG